MANAQQTDAEHARSFSLMSEKVKDYAIFLMDPHGLIRTWNPAAAAMKGYAKEDAIGAYFGMLYSQEDQARGHPQHNLQAALEQGTFQEEGWRRKKDGSTFWAQVEIIAVTNESGELTGFCKITRDVTERKALHEMVSRERERCQVTLGAISDAVISFDSEGKIDYLNAKAEELTGWQSAQAQGRQLPEVVELRDGEAGEKVEPAPGNGAGVPATAVLIGKDGRRREVEHAGASIQSRDGSAGGGVVVVRDISHVRSVEKELKHADRRKDEFLAMLAHELRNPLAPIASATELLGMARLDAAGVQRTVEVLRRQVRHMTGLIDDLLDVSRVTRGLVELVKEELDFRGVVAHALEQARPAIDSRSHHVTLDLAPGDAVVEGDQKRLVQVISNLLANSAKYTPPGGHIVVSMALRDLEVEVSIQDDGIGLTAELLQRAFQMFAQAERTADRSQGGLGLGLALVRSLVELHGGRVTAESEGPGHGSKFTVVLPRVVRTASPILQQHERVPLAAGLLRVLVVDDNVDAAHLLALWLQALGHEVAMEHHAEAALALALAGHFAPQVCLLDIGLPDFDGFELARRLRRMWPDAVLVAVTGYGQPQDVQSALEAGYDHHFVKPVDKQQLSGILNAAAKRAGT
ncbi:PAS domain S-box protein [Ramlibacter sp.]|uniref:hybrid sensor histidine kinase/response regulator n=1 Tax=Ramlibacter sp. TaxID=1917967 RepID=UPI001794493E|nr:PAS domain S-box protein [Ramlibacter sp.]MBA2675740.1 PAS domain S-box protein [Ramlibacter sp.]